MKAFIKFYITVIILLSSAYPIYAASQLTWDASSGVVTGYRIYYGTSSGVYSGMEEVGNVLQYPLSSLPLQEKTTYYLVVKAYNASGESAPSNEVTWYCPDSTPPAPPVNLSRQIVSGNVQLNWTANTESDLQGYNVYKGTSTGIYGTPTPFGKVSTYTVSGLTQGSKYYFVITSLDASSNESGYSIEVNATIPDTTAPTVAITSPTSGSTYATASSTVALSGTAGDNVGVVSTVRWANAANSTSGTATGTTSWSVSGISLASGANVITVTASDAAGYTTGKTLTVTVTYTPPDTTAPTVAITSPTSNTTYAASSSTVSLTGTASDNVGVSTVRWANAANSTSGTATGTASWSVSGISLAAGANAITVTASDAAGYTAGKTLTVTYTPPDTTAPTVAITSPTSSDTYATSSSTVSISGTAGDNVGVSTVTWANAANSTSGAATGTTSWSVSGISLAAGANAVTVTASDAAGYTASKTLTVTYTTSSIAQVDTTTPTLTIASPTTLSTYSTRSSNIKLAGKASDNIGITSVKWANAANGRSGTATGTTSWLTSNIALRIGLNVITVTTYDAAGNSAQKQLSVTRRR